MLYRTITPPPSLAAYVRHFWVLEGSIAEPYIHRCMADGCADLIFHYKGKFDKLAATNQPEDCFLSGIQGQSPQYRRFIITQDFGMVGVNLYPHALPRLFSIPAYEFTNHMPDLATALGTKAAELEERVMLADNNEQRINVIAAFLEQQLPHASQTNAGVVAMINYVMAGNTACNVDELAKKNFLSTRQFERNFKALSGYSPKLFTRIMRFQSTLTKYRNKHKSLTDIAYECGYYDQSHFIHDFKEFSGYHPMQYFTGKEEGISAQAI